jgi:hypothetical protein
MSYHQDLLEQARLLAEMESGKPRQASLRRAVSAAYYALFHSLVDQACRQMFGTAHRSRLLRQAVARAFDHRAMKGASKAFATGQLPLGLRGRAAVPSPLREIAEAFVLLQEQPHQADYNLARPFRREEVAILVDKADACVRRLWPQVAQQDGSRLYLAALLLWEKLKSR